MIDQRQITNNIMMIRPAAFGYNAETAANNSFQTNDTSLSPQQIADQAREEFDAMVAQLRAHNVNVIVIEDTEVPHTPDAVFPNNWISFHSDGLVLTYPMFSPLRRQERREDIITKISETFDISRDYTLAHYEDEDLYLEGTGSLIIDRPNNIAYAALSQRTDITLLDKWSVLTGYKTVPFVSVDKSGDPIYHTNVMMALGVDFAVICLDSIPDEGERARVVKTLNDSGKEIIDISQDQVEHFAGNMLQVVGGSMGKLLVMSDTALQSLTPAQKAQLEARTEILAPRIPTIEKYGGGSVRCMMAEVFLPRKKA